MAMKKGKGYKVDFVNRVITVTKEFHHRASNDNHEEHTVFKNLVNELPGFRVAFTATRKRKPTRERLTYEKMIEYICRQEGAEDLLHEFNEIRTPKESLTHAPYPYVKRWFLARFPYYDQMTPFDEQGRIIGRGGQYNLKAGEAEGQNNHLGNYLHCQYRKRHFSRSIIS